MLIKIVKPDFIFENENGSLKQLVHDGWKQINIISSVSGAVRGGHYHKYNDEAFYIISGNFNLKAWKKNDAEEYHFKEGDMFIIPSFVYHTFNYIEDTTLISMYSNGVEISETEKDIWNN